MGFFIYSEVSLLFVVALLAATLKLRSLDSSLISPQKNHEKKRTEV